MDLFNRKELIMELTSKEKLINATIEVISESGLHSVTTAKIAKKAKLSEAMIYKNFGNKDHMIVESFLKIKKGLNDFVVSRLQGIENFEAQLYALWLGQFDYFVTNKDYLSVLIQFEHSKYMTESIRSSCYETISPLIAYFEKGVKLNMFKPMNIEILNALYFSPILSLAESIVSGRLEKNQEILDFVFEGSMKAISK
jgi:AcrR family transcriptional regulator